MRNHSKSTQLVTEESKEEEKPEKTPAHERVEEVLRSDSIRKDELLLCEKDEVRIRDDLEHGKDHVMVHRVLNAD